MDYAQIYPFLGIQARGAFYHWWIHQTFNNRSRVIKYYYPHNPRTADQQSNRVLFYDAVKNWQGFGEDVKSFYNAQVLRKPLSGYNRYISLYLEANKDVIVYWKTLEKDASDVSTIADYIESKVPVKAIGAEVDIGTDDAKFATSKAIDDSYLSEVSDSLYRQALINGNFDIWQRSTAFTAGTTPPNDDDTWITDRWLLLSDGDDIVDIIRGSAGTLVGSKYVFVFQVETADKRFGLCQILENADSEKLDDQTVSLSFLAKTVGTEVANCRAAVISWSGTADAVTSDVVSDWESEGIDPTLATNWTYENIPSDLALTASWQRFKIEGISVDTASMTNLAILIWADDDDCAINDRFYLSQVLLNQGDKALPFQPKKYGVELADCERFCYTIKTIRTNQVIGIGSGHDADTAMIYIPFPVTMRSFITLTATAGEWRIYRGLSNMGDVTALSLTATYSGSNACVANASVSAGLTAGDAYTLQGDGTAGRVMIFDSEL